MEQTKHSVNCIVEINNGVVKPRNPILKNVRMKSLGDYKNVYRGTR